MFFDVDGLYTAASLLFSGVIFAGLIPWAHELVQPIPVTLRWSRRER